MSERSSAVLTEMLSWPAAERGDMAAHLLQSLDPDLDSGVDAAWDDEIRVRLEDIRSGRVTSIPWAEAREQILKETDDAG